MHAISQAAWKGLCISCQLVCSAGSTGHGAAPSHIGKMEQSSASGCEGLNLSRYPSPLFQRCPAGSGRAPTSRICPGDASQH